MLLSTGYLRTVTFEEEAWITSAEVSVIQLFSISTKNCLKAPRFQIFSDFFQASQLQACWRGYDLLGSSLSRRGKEFQTRYNHVHAGSPIYAFPMASGLSAEAMNVRNDMFRRQLCKEEEPELWEEMKEEGVLGIFSKAGKEVAEITFFR